MAGIQEVFGKFAVQVEGGEVKLFDKKAEAQECLTAFESGAENLSLAKDYCRARGVDPEGKAGISRCNVIVDFLMYASTLEERMEDELASIEDTAVEEAPAPTPQPSNERTKLPWED